jgi:hypothetical protein
MINLNNLNKKQLSLLIFESIMALFYPTFGILLLTTDIFYFPKIITIILGIIFIMYGIFRIYRTIKKLAGL